MIPPDQLCQRQVEDYILHVRDDFGRGQGDVHPIWAALEFLYVNTLGYDWPLFTKTSASHAAAPAGGPLRTRTVAASWRPSSSPSFAAVSR